MKKGWTYKKLGEVADVVHGKNQKDVLSDNGKYPIYGSGGNIMGYADDYLCEAGTTILGRKGSINNPQFIEERFWNVDTAFGISAKEGNDSKFIYYFITSIDWLKKNTGTTLPSLTQQVVKSVELPVPLLKEQKRIVERLDAAFAQIDELKANAEKQLTEARALFQKSLAKAMEPKEGWEEKALGDVCSLSQGLAINSHTKHLFIQNGSLPLLRIKDMKEGTREIFVDEANCPQGCIASEEDIIYTRTGTLGLVFTGMHGVLHNNCFKIKHDINKLNKSFLIYFLRNDSFVKTIIGLASRAAQPDITHKLFKAQEIHFPPLAEQQRIVERLDALSENIRKYEEIQRKIIAECDALKQALLRQVFE